MKYNEKYVFLWYGSILALCAAIAVFALCFFNSFMPILYVLIAVFLAIFAVMFTLASKNLKCKAGCTHIQAISLYSAARKLAKKTGENERSGKILLEAAKKEDALKNFDEEKLRQCYDIGKDDVAKTKSALLLRLWGMSAKK